MSDTRGSDGDREAERILALVKGDPLEAYRILERQLGVLVLRTQVLLSLSGIVITVTGFSGRAIALSGEAARVCISLGLLVVLAAAAVAIVGVLRLRWLSQRLGEDALEMVREGLRLRDSKARHLGAALVLFVIGFALYCAAIVQLLLAAAPR